MTIYRRPGSIGATLLGALHDLSAAEVEAATGKTATNFYQIASPENNRDLHLNDAAALDAALRVRGLPPRFLPFFLERTEDAIARLGGGPAKPKVNLTKPWRTAA
jgi:hypothetical protein